VREVTGERLGSTLRKLAEALVTERRHVAQLEREVRELRAELESRRRSVADRETRTPLSPAA
jgi:uncharacterized coiled-coil protein SlyX